MLDLSQLVERKFTDIIDTPDWQIKTDTGWEDVKNVRQTVQYQVWIMRLADGDYIKCADDHIVFREDYTQVFVKDLQVGDLVITEDGPVEVELLERTDVWENMYDVEVESPNHRYYSNGILSHNTATLASYALHHVLFADRKNVKILANKYDTAKGIIDRIKKMYEQLPRWLQQGVLAWNAGSLELENYSTITVGTTTPDSGRSSSISLLILDEFAFVRPSIADEFWAAVYPVISSGQESKVIIVSTPNGMNLFYKLYTDAEQKRNFFKHYLVTWDKVPGRDDKWKNETIANLGGDFDLFEQEYSCSFQGNSNTLIPMSKLKTLVYRTPIRQSESFSIFEQPQRDHIYFIPVDVSRGVGNDYSAFHVIDITQYPYRQVATYRNNTIDHNLLPSTIDKWASQYNKAYILLEANDLGESVGDMLYNELEYENLLLVSHQGRAGQRLGGGHSKSVRTGVMTSVRTKNLGCSNLKSMISTDQLIINDFMTIQELSTFVQKKESYAAEEGAHDDLAMGLVVFGWAVQEPYFKDLTDRDFRVKMEQEREDEMMETVPVFGFIEDGIQDDGWEDVQDQPFGIFN